MNFDTEGGAVEMMGGESVIVDKLYGPLIFWPLRITPSLETCEWVIERLFGADNEWHEVCRVPGQLGLDFADDEEQERRA